MHRGLRLIPNKETSVKNAIRDAPAPARIVLMLSPEEVANILIAVGEQVLLGQALLRSASRVLHAPVSGTVVEIRLTDSSSALAIENDGLDTPHPDIAPVDYLQLSPNQLQRQIAEAGIVGLGGAEFPTSTKLSVAEAQRTKLLIVNCVECEPFITCDDALLREQSANIILGTQALMHASGASDTTIAIEADKPEAYRAMTRALEAAHDQRIRVRMVATLYPAGGERQLIQTLTGREVPSGGIPADIDTLCQNAGTTVAVARWITTGEPLISRVVTVTGSGVKEPQNLRVRFGTPIASVVANCGGYTANSVRLLRGGTMMGVALSDDLSVVSAATNCILVATHNDISPRRTEMPCIRCGDCADACPASLLPQQLFRYARARDRVALQELGLRDCIECGCCDFVCPSQIPLTSTFVEAKRFVAEEM